MFDFTDITIRNILDFCAAMIILVEFCKVALDLGSPFKELKKRVDQHDTFFRKDKDHLKKIDDKVGKIDDGVIVMGKALNELLRHVITGNDIDELKSQQKALNDYFYDDKIKD